MFDSIPDFTKKIRGFKVSPTVKCVDFFPSKLDLVFLGADADKRNVGDTAFTFFFDFEGSTACDGPWTGLFGGSSSSKFKSET